MCLYFLKNKMQVDQEDQKVQSDGPKENADKKSDTEDMEVTNSFKLHRWTQMPNGSNKQWWPPFNAMITTH